MPIKPEILKRQTVIRTRLFRVDEVQLRFSNGAERTYEKLCSGGPGAVLIVPLLNDKTLLMIREYAAGLDGYHLACPKGAVDPGEELLAAANRELQEEVGYAARKLTFLKKLHLSPSYMEHGINVIIAQDLYPSRLEGDEPEPIEVEEVPFTNLSELCMRDDVSEGRTIAALFLVREWLSQASNRELVSE